MLHIKLDIRQLQQKLLKGVSKCQRGGGEGAAPRLTHSSKMSESDDTGVINKLCEFWGADRAIDV